MSASSTSAVIQPPAAASEATGTPGPTGEPAFKSTRVTTPSKGARSWARANRAVAARTAPRACSRRARCGGRGAWALRAVGARRLPGRLRLEGLLVGDGDRLRTGSRPQQIPLGDGLPVAGPGALYLRACRIQLGLANRAVAEELLGPFQGPPRLFQGRTGHLDGAVGLLQFPRLRARPPLC